MTSDPVPAHDDTGSPATEPLWRRDFPYSSAGEEEVTRREFARYLALGSGVLATGTLGIAAWTQLRTINHGEPRPIVALDQIPVGGTYLFKYPTASDPAIMLRASHTEVVGFSQKCTHLGCVVFFEEAENRWHCPCHEGNFEARTGAVISGPPTRPLGRIALEIRGDTVWALGSNP
jgi:nitrite reductase/ring-hydroxylating ferredoxin subunit